MNRRLLLLLACVLTTAVAVGQKTEKLQVERLPDLNIARYSHCVFYANGELTVVGGHTSGYVPTATAEYYCDGAWHLMNAVYPHDDGMMVSLDGGRKVLIAGGHEKNLGIGQTFEAEMYYPETHSFDGFGCLDRKRALFQGVELDSGQVLIVGNHMGNDAIEMFDGRKFFRHVRDVLAWRSMPYVLPVSGGDVMIFGSVWNGQRSLPCDIVDRLNGEPFHVPLLAEWMPIVFEQNSHAVKSFIGNKEMSDYSYLISAFNDSGDVAIILVEDTCFSLLPTTCPLPIAYGRDVLNLSPAVVDTHAHRLYLVGIDTSSKVMVVAVDYDQRPAPVTLYTSDPLPNFGNSSPLLTPDGDLVVTGGIIDDNFTPLASVWLLRLGDGNAVATAESSWHRIWWWLLGALMVVVVAVVLLRKRHKSPTSSAEGTPCAVSVEENAERTEVNSTDSDLMNSIVQLMEQQHLYLNPELKVTDVADVLGVHRNAVSACINSQQGCTFRQWVNDYRLQHAKRLLVDTPDMKMSAIGMESGFANERSFFRSFKEATGLTPKEWQAQQDKMTH